MFLFLNPACILITHLSVSEVACLSVQQGSKASVTNDFICPGGSHCQCTQLRHKCNSHDSCAHSHTHTLTLYSLVLWVAADRSYSEIRETIARGISQNSYAPERVGAVGLQEQLEPWTWFLSLRWTSHCLRRLAASSLYSAWQKVRSPKVWKETQRYVTCIRCSSCTSQLCPGGHGHVKTRWLLRELYRWSGTRRGAQKGDAEHRVPEVLTHPSRHPRRWGLSWEYKKLLPNWEVGCSQVMADRCAIK